MRWVADYERADGDIINSQKDLPERLKRRRCMKKELIELILTESAKPVPQHTEVGHTPKGVVIGTLVELSESGVPIVSFDDVPELIAARSTVAVSQNEIGKDAVL